MKKKEKKKKDFFLLCCSHNFFSLVSIVLLFFSISPSASSQGTLFASLCFPPSCFSFLFPLARCCILPQKVGAFDRRKKQIGIKAGLERKGR